MPSGCSHAVCSSLCTPDTYNDLRKRTSEEAVCEEKENMSVLFPDVIRTVECSPPLIPYAMQLPATYSDIPISHGTCQYDDTVDSGLSSQSHHGYPHRLESNVLPFEGSRSGGPPSEVIIEVTMPQKEEHFPQQIFQGIHSAVEESPAAASLPPAVILLQNLLSDWYTSTRLPLENNGLPDGWKSTEWDFFQFFAGIVMVEQPGLEEMKHCRQTFGARGETWNSEYFSSQHAGRQTSMTLSTLFVSSNRMKSPFDANTTFTVAVSCAGSGTTTLFMVIAPYLWALHRLWCYKFDLVFARELHFKEVHCASDAVELLGLDSLELSDQQCRDVINFIQQSPHRICLILNGMDGILLQNCSEYVTGVLNGSELTGIYVLITSRPWGGIFQLQSLQQEDTRVVEVAGVRSEDVRMYIRNICSKSDSELLLELLQQEPHIFRLMASPALAFEIITLYRSQKRLPLSVSDLFEMLILQLAAELSGEIYSNWRTIPIVLQHSILELGKVAFDMLLAGQLAFNDLGVCSSFAFPNSFVLRGVRAKVGHGPNVGQQWHFRRQTIMESLAVKYVSSRESLTSDKIIELVKMFGANTSRVPRFWILLAAQLSLPEHMETLAGMLLDQYNIWRCIRHGQPEDAVEGEPSTEEEEADHLPPYRIQLPNGTDFVSAGSTSDCRMLVFECFEEFALHQEGPVQPVPSISSCLQHQNGHLLLDGSSDAEALRTIAVVVQHHSSAAMKIGLQGFMQPRSCRVPNSLKSCTNLSSLQIQHCSNIGATVGAIVQSSASQLTKLKISSCELGRRDIVHVLRAIAGCSKLETLEISSTALDIYCVTVLSRSLHHTRSLKEITLSNSLGNAGDCALDELCTGLSCCSEIQLLDLSNCKLQATSLELLTDCFPHWPGLAEIVLDDNELSDVSDHQEARFIKAVSECSSIQFTSFERCLLPPSSRLLSLQAPDMEGPEEKAQLHVPSEKVVFSNLEGSLVTT